MLSVNEVKQAIKKIISNYHTSLVLIVSLAFGAATNAAVFGWVEAFVLNPLPSVDNNQALYSITTVAGEDDFIDSSYKDFADMRASGTLLENTFAYKSWTFSARVQEAITPVSGSLVTGNFFNVLALKPHLGRFFHSSDNTDVRSGNNVVVLSHHFWQSQFSGEQDIVGKSITLKDQVYTIIGIAPEGFWGATPYNRDNLWVPVGQMSVFSGSDKWFEERQTRPFKIMTRLYDGVTPEQLQAQLNLVTARLSADHPQTNQSIGAKAYPFIDTPEGGASQLTQLIVVLYLTSIVILIIICANLLNISFVQAVAREKEFSIKQAVGAGRGRIAVNLLFEGAVISFIAALVSIFCVHMLYNLLSSQNMSTPLFVVSGNSLPQAVVVYCFVITFISGLLNMVAPLIRIRAVNLASSLQDSMRGSTTGKVARTIRNALIVFQVCLAFSALNLAASFVNSSEKVQAINPGFDDNDITLVNLAPVNSIPERSQYMAYLDGTISRLNTIPSVEQIAYSEFVPLGGGGGSWETIAIEGYTFAPDENAKLYRNFVSDNYFDLLGIDIVQGRSFDGNDTPDNAPVAIVNQAFADKYFADKALLGRKIRGWSRDIIIVGIAADSKINRLTEETKPYFYLPFRQFSSTGKSTTLHVKLASGKALPLSSIKDVIQQQGAGMYIAWSMPLANYIQGSSYTSKVATVALSILSGIALFLAAIGIYGVVNRSVVQRTQEIGIRMAIGASSGQIAVMILRQLLSLVALGCVLGYGLISLINDDLKSLLYDHLGYESGLIIMTLVSIISVALLASLIPSIHASRVQPARALAGN